MISAAERIEEIRAEIRRMRAELSGCDWCCGGGDEAMGRLQLELAALGGEDPGYDD